MSATLKPYRVYCFDSARSIVTADFIQAADDQDAIAKARAKGFGTRCELWDGRRMVAELAQEQRA